MTRTASTTLPARRTTGTGLVQGIIESPLGPLAALACDAGLMGLWFDQQQHSPGLLDAPRDDEQRWIAQARAELALYFAGRLREFKVPLAPRGTAVIATAGPNRPLDSVTTIARLCVGETAYWPAPRHAPAGRHETEVIAVNVLAMAPRGAAISVARCQTPRNSTAPIAANWVGDTL